MPTAAELHEAGLEALVGRRLATARRLLERARESADSPDLAARIDASLAYVSAEQGDLSVALAMCDAALTRDGVQFETSAVLHSQRALVLSRMGDTPAALDAFSMGIAMLSDPVELAKALTNRGMVHLERGAGQLAGADFTRAVELFRSSDHTVGAAMAEHDLGCADLLRGDLVSALAHMDAVRPILIPLSPIGVAITNKDRAEALMAAGMTRSGLAALDEVARTFGNHRLHQRRGETELTVARACLMADPHRALAAARAARSRFARPHSPDQRVRAEALVLGAEVRLRRSGPSLITRADALTEELSRLEMPWWAIDTRLDAALVALRRGDVDEARRRLAGIRVPARAPLAVRLRDRDVRAALAERTGRRADALRHIRRGLGDLHEWQSSFGSLDLQTMVTGHGRRLAVRGLRVAVAARPPKVLFEWSERARMLASRVQPVRVPHDEQVLEDLQELRALAAVEDPTREVAVRQAELRQRVRERAWQHRGSGEYDDPVTLGDVQARLQPHQALVAYVVTAEVTALVVTREAATVVGLGETVDLEALLGGLLPDLDMAAAELPEVFAQAIRSELRGRLRRLDDVLL